MQDEKIVQIGEFIRKAADDVSKESGEKLAEAVSGVREEISKTKASLERLFNQLKEACDEELSETESRRATSILKTHEIFEEGIDKALEVADERITEAVQASQDALSEQIESVSQEFIAERETIVKSLEDAMADAEQSHVVQIEQLTKQLKEQQTFEAMLTTRLEEIKDGEQGFQGEQGEPGQDRPLLEPVVLDDDKDYPKNVLGSFNNGLWISTKQAVGGPSNDPHAWHCVLDAMATMSIDLQADHTFKVSVRMATGQLIEDEFDIPYHEHRGIHEEGKSYSAGNWVTKGHSMWQAMEDTDKTPPGNGWKQILTAPRGKAGPAGESIRGPEGKPGRNGLDAKLPDGFIDELKYLANKAFEDGRSGSYAVNSFRGYFTPTEQYVSGDVVNFDGSLFVCTSSGTYRSIALSNGAFELMLGVPKVAHVPYMHWRGQWVQKTYKSGDTVRDSGWTMVAITETNERPSPQQVGQPIWVSGLGDTPNWGAPQQSSPTPELIYGQRYSLAQTGYVNSTRVWVDEADPNITYTVAIIGNPDTESETINFVLNDASFASTGWVSIPTQDVLVVEGSVFDVAVIKRDRNTSVSETLPYNYSTPNNESIPLSGQLIHANRLVDELWISTEDSLGDDQSSVLANLHSGDTISGAGVTWTIISSTDNGSYYVFTVSPAVQGTAGLGDFIFTTFTAQPINYVELPDHYIANDSVIGFYTEDGLGTKVLDEDGYGIDIEVQEAYLPTDWEVVTPGNVGGTPSQTVSAMSQTEKDWVKARSEPIQDAIMTTDGNGWEELMRVPLPASSGYVVEYWVTGKRLDDDGYVAGKWGALLTRNGAVDVSVKTIYQHMEPGVRVRLTPDGSDAVFEVDGASNERWRWRLSADVGEI